MSLQGLDLFQLVPAFHRVRDAQLAPITASEAAQLSALQALPPPLSGGQDVALAQLTAKSRGPLQCLLMLVQEQLEIVANDLDQLYDDQFIETCAPWVIPYIGDLIGYQSVNEVASVTANQRAEVAHTISFRRRKGTVLVLEQLAADATGWGAHAVEFFKVLAWTQYMNHLRLFNHYAPNLRRWEPREYMDTGFDATAHTVDVRRIAVERGRYNVQNVGIFLWSLNAYSITNSPASLTGTPSAGQPVCFRFNSLGMDMPLFHQAISQGSDITALAQPFNVPDRLRRRVLCEDIRKGGATYYGATTTSSLEVYSNGQLLDASQIRVCDLSGSDGQWRNTPTGSNDRVAIDPALGRIALPPLGAGAPVPCVQATYYYGFNADIGGGEYPRNLPPHGFIVSDPAFVFQFPDNASPVRYQTLQQALDYAKQVLPAAGQAAVEIADTTTLEAPGLTINNLPEGTTLELRAANTTRTTLLLDGEICVTGAAGSAFALNGFLVAGCKDADLASPPPKSLVHVPANNPDQSLNLLSQLALTHCALAPGRRTGPQSGVGRLSLCAEPPGVQVNIEKCILGAVRSNELAAVIAHDSIFDATDPTAIAYAALDDSSGGGALTLKGCTVIGKVHATLLTLVSNSIVWAELAPADSWAAPLVSDRKQQGCVRFSYLPAGSVVPRNFKCVPAHFERTPQAPGSPQPLFVSLRYGDPAYCKLFASTPGAVRRGADDGGEMGAFHFVKAPLREDNLRIRMQEYLPAGLEFGIFYQT